MAGAFKKTLHLGSTGKTEHNSRVFCRVEFDGRRLSISGVEGPLRNGDALGGCGQILETLDRLTFYAPGWDADSVSRFAAYWERWHLNDMRAGTPAQETAVKTWLADGNRYDYDRVCLMLRGKDLNPDKSNPRDPYRYGTRWLFEAIPLDVLEYLESLPESEVTPAWV